MDAFCRILVATDFGKSAALAEDYAVALAAKFGSHITLAHVFEPPAPYDGSFGFPMPELTAAAAAALANAFARFKGRCLESDSALGIGAPWEQILSIAKDHVVLGAARPPEIATSRRGAGSGALARSVAGGGEVDGRRAR
jgi:nucleotide-binding universal stress UspA family protein